jgi:hypothetical protein
MADDGATTERTENETSEDGAEDAKASDERSQDEPEDESSDAAQEETEDAETSSDEPDDADEHRDKEDARTCDECGAPLTSEVADFKIASDSKWADMGGAGEVKYAEVCSNEDCPTRRPDGEPEADESESEDTASA